jgi:hypothetical protein
MTMMLMSTSIRGGFSRGTLISLTASANNVDIFALAGSPVEPTIVNVIIDPGVIIGSVSTATPAMDIGSFVSGTIVNIINKGRIQGAGGAGTYHTTVGEDGGDALHVTVPVIIDNTLGQIWSGGGGGGGSYNWTICSGGGGAGTVPGWGSPYHVVNTNEYPDGSGTSEAGGIPGYFKGLVPGSGGNPGQHGGQGNGEGTVKTEGGVAGYSISGVSNVTWSTGSQEGSVLGPTI